MNQKATLNEILYRLYALKAQSEHITLEQAAQDTRQKQLAWFSSLPEERRALILRAGDLPTPEEFLAFLLKEIAGSL